MQTKPLSSLLVCQKGLEILQNEYFKTEFAEFEMDYRPCEFY